MAIVSISIPDDLLAAIDAAQEELGFSGRSEYVRTALHTFLSDTQQKHSSGIIDGVLFVIHDDARTGEIYEMRHQYEEIVETQLHHHLENEKGLELFLLRGEAAQVEALHRSLQTHAHVEYVKLITP